MSKFRTSSPKEHFVFLVGPPAYLSLTWPDDVTAVEKGTTAVGGDSEALLGRCLKLWSAQRI